MSLSFSCLIVLTRISDTVLNRNASIGCACLSLREKAFNNSLLSFTPAVSFVLFCFCKWSFTRLMQFSLFLVAKSLYHKWVLNLVNEYFSVGETAITTPAIPIVDCPISALGLELPPSENWVSNCHLFLFPSSLLEKPFLHSRYTVNFLVFLNIITCFFCVYWNDHTIFFSFFLCWWGKLY